MALQRLARFLSLMTAIVLTSATSAYAKPSLTLTLPSQADAGTPTHFSWSGPSGGHLAVQRQVGTAHVWRTVARLSRTTGSGQLPALPLGAYTLRIVHINAHGTILAQRGRSLHVFGSVPFSQLLAGWSHPGPGTYSWPGGIFDYFLRYYSDSGFAGQFTVSSSACRSLHVDFVPELYTGVSGAATGVTVTVVQPAADPVSASTAADTMGSLDATISPGMSWGIQDSATPANTATYIDMNGSASCYSSQSLPEPT
jgi:hypothetical protein